MEYLVIDVYHKKGRIMVLCHLRCFIYTVFLFTPTCYATITFQSNSKTIQTPRHIEPESIGNIGNIPIIVTDTGDVFHLPREVVDEDLERQLQTFAEYLNLTVTQTSLNKFKSKKEFLCTERYVQDLSNAKYEIGSGVYNSRENNPLASFLGAPEVSYEANANFKYFEFTSNRISMPNSYNPDEFEGIIKFSETDIVEGIKAKLSPEIRAIVSLSTTMEHLKALSVLSNDIKLINEVNSYYSTKKQIEDEIREANWCIQNEPLDPRVSVRVEIVYSLWGIDSLANWINSAESFNYQCFGTNPTEQSIQISEPYIYNDRVTYHYLAKRKNLTCSYKTVCTNYENVNIGINLGRYCTATKIEKIKKWSDLPDKTGQISLELNGKATLSYKTDFSRIKDLSHSLKIPAYDSLSIFLNKLPPLFKHDKYSTEYSQPYTKRNISINDAVIIQQMLEEAISKKGM